MVKLYSRSAGPSSQRWKVSGISLLCIAENMSSASLEGSGLLWWQCCHSDGLIIAWRIHSWWWGWLVFFLKKVCLQDSLAIWRPCLLFRQAEDWSFFLRLVYILFPSSVLHIPAIDKGKSIFLTSFVVGNSPGIFPWHDLSQGSLHIWWDYGGPPAFSSEALCFPRHFFVDAIYKGVQHAPSISGHSHSHSALSHPQPCCHDFGTNSSRALLPFAAFHQLRRSLSPCMPSPGLCPGSLFLAKVSLSSSHCFLYQIAKLLGCLPACLCLWLYSSCTLI